MAMSKLVGVVVLSTRVAIGRGKETRGTNSTDIKDFSVARIGDRTVASEKKDKRENLVVREESFKRR
jgi:hypothetical protein